MIAPLKIDADSPCEKSLDTYPAMMTIDQVAQACSLHRRTVERWEEVGRLPAAIRNGRFIRFRKADLVSWMQSGCPVRRIRHSKEAA